MKCHLIVAKFCPSNPNGAKLNQKYEPTPDGLSVSAHGRLFAVLAPPSPRLVPALYCPLGALHLHRGVPWTVTSASKKPWTCTCARCASLSIRCAVVCDTPARGHVPVARRAHGYDAMRRRCYLHVADLLPGVRRLLGDGSRSDIVVDGGDASHTPRGHGTGAQFVVRFVVECLAAVCAWECALQHAGLGR